MNSWKISRRALIRGGSAAIGLPLLDIMSSRDVIAGQSTSETAQVVRAAYLYFPNGVADGAWGAKRFDSQGHILELNEGLSPLHSLREHIVIPRNMWTPRGNGHGAGTATWLTGGGYDGRKIEAGGLSVDQIAARQFRDQTLLPSLELSLKGEGYFANSLERNTISWSEVGPVPRDVEPRVVFDRMFRARRKSDASESVLDGAIEDARSMRRRGSIDDRRKIDEYLASIRAIERRMAFAEAQVRRARQTPALQAEIQRPSYDIPTDHETYIQTMLDMIVLAFWSDATRVSSFMLDHGQSNRYFNFIDGVQGTWHALSHWKDASGRTDDDDGTTSWASPVAKRQQYNAVTRWHTAQVAYFLQRLNSIQEPDGRTLLDNSMILYGSSLADGHEHEERDLPLLLAGGGGGTIRSGRQIDFGSDRSMSDLHLAMLQRLTPGIKQFAESTTEVTLS
ncbi:MAG: DUF1552 domain-containing protein [Aureliella sp.]